jgi:hypothetical protein
MPASKLDVAGTGQSRCKGCGKQIPKGEHRFLGFYGSWYHLACAAEQRPRGFDGALEKRAAKLLAANPPKAPAAAPRDAELEAALRANPDEATRRVFADALLARGDVWGEILALELAGKPADALFKKHAKKLMGGLPPKLFSWERGFIDEVVLEMRGVEYALQQLDDVCALPAAVLLRSLAVRIGATPELARRISERAPTLRKLLAWVSLGKVDCLGDLALPKLEELRIYLQFQPRKGQLEGLFANRKLPSLRRLEMWTGSSPGNELAPEILEAFIASPLIRQLTHLKMYQGALDQAGVTRLKRAGVDLPDLKMSVKVW